MKALLLSAGLALALIAPAQAEPGSELSDPIVAFTPVIAQNADALGLTAAQRADLEEWMEYTPAQIEALDARVAKARAELRAAIIRGSTVKKRSVLASRLGQLEAKRIMMRSVCTDHWREVLTREQFEKMLELAAAQ